MELPLQTLLSGKKISCEISLAAFLSDAKFDIADNVSMTTVRKRFKITKALGL
jgi:hypothetical protein